MGLFIFHCVSKVITVTDGHSPPEWPGYILYASVTPLPFVAVFDQTVTNVHLNKLVYLASYSYIFSAFCLYP